MHRKSKFDVDVDHSEKCCRCRDSDLHLSTAFFNNSTPAHVFFQGDESTPGALVSSKRVAFDDKTKRIRDTLRAVQYLRNDITHRFCCPHCPAVYSWAMENKTGIVYFQLASKTRRFKSSDSLQWLQLIDPKWRMEHAGDDMLLRTHCPDRYCKTSIDWMKARKTLDGSVSTLM